MDSPSVVLLWVLAAIYVVSTLRYNLPRSIDNWLIRDADERFRYEGFLAVFLLLAGPGAAFVDIGVACDDPDYMEQFHEDLAWAYIRRPQQLGRWISRLVGPSLRALWRDLTLADGEA